MKEQKMPVFPPQFAEMMLAWYREKRRELPWRKTADPYSIWISEIMLQQTRVEAVKPYYARFLNVCPDVQSLAQLPGEKLMKLWEGLGYYSRARNLQAAACEIVNRFGGKLPSDYNALLSLPGFGEYTAGAVASIAFGIRVPAVDGNVLRVLTRLTGLFEDITLPASRRCLRDALCPVIPVEAGDFNQSLIELGATVCIPNGEPLCDRCPLRTFCEAYRNGWCRLLPVRSPKKPRRVEEKTVLVIRDGERTALHKRQDRGLLAGLYELPNVEGFRDEQSLPDLIRSFGFEPLQIRRLEDAKHIFTHVEWRMRGYFVRIAPEFDGLHGKSGYQLIPDAVLQAEYAVPSAFSAYVKYLNRNQSE